MMNINNAILLSSIKQCAEFRATADYIYICNLQCLRKQILHANPLFSPIFS